MDWLHFVGRSYYTQKNFVREAQEHGVSRKISKRLLGGFRWGDRIWLAQGDMKKRTRITPFNGSEVFAYFILTTIAGVPREIIDQLPEVKQISKNVEMIRRGCGSYQIGPSFTTTATVQEIAQAVREDSSIGTILIQGPITVLEKSVRLLDVGSRWGFQHVDGQLIEEAIRDESFIIDGDIGMESSIESGLPSGRVAVLNNYETGNEYGPLSMDDDELQR